MIRHMKTHANLPSLEINQDNKVHRSLGEPRRLLAGVVRSSRLNEYLNVGVFMSKAPSNNAGMMVGINLDSEEVQALRDLCDEFLDPGGVERRFEELRERLMHDPL